MQALKLYFFLILAVTVQLLPVNSYAERELSHVARCIVHIRSDQLSAANRKFGPDLTPIMPKGFKTSAILKLKRNKSTLKIDEKNSVTTHGRSLCFRALRKNKGYFNEVNADSVVTIVDTAVTPNDTYLSYQWSIDNSSNASAAGADIDINAPLAWGISTGASNTIVPVIDTGIDYTHPDLLENIWTNPYEIPDNGVDDDNNGYIDDMHGWDFVNKDNNPMDGHGHGTHVAGTIGAVGNNSAGIAGVVWSADLVALKALSDSGAGFMADLKQALLYALVMNFRLSNNSWGGGGKHKAFLRTLTLAEEQNHLFIAAAGNSSNDNDLQPFYPSNYELDNVLSVASIDKTGLRSSFSNYGVTSVDIAAPGGNILSTYPGGRYAFLSGTSMATPHVTGVATLLLSNNPDLSSTDIKSLILSSAKPVADLAGKVATGGTLNAHAATVAAAAATPGELATPTPIPTATPTSTPKPKKKNNRNNNNKRKNK